MSKCPLLTIMTAMVERLLKPMRDQTVILRYVYLFQSPAGSFAITAGLEQMIQTISKSSFTEEDMAYLRN